jgi:hypothetical protein
MTPGREKWGQTTQRELVRRQQAAGALRPADDDPPVPMPLLPLIRLARERGVDPLRAIADSHRPMRQVFAEEDARKEGTP